MGLILILFSTHGLGDESSSVMTARSTIPMGETASCAIYVLGPGASEYGEEELYDVKITILEALRGKEAWDRLHAASTFNKSEEDGFEFILTRIRFEYYARDTPGNKSYEIKKDDFKVYSGDSQSYKAPSVLPPKPGLIGRVFWSGDSYEGWIPFLVAKEDKKPFMFFSGGLWFQLF